MPTIDRYVSAYDPSSIPWTSFATDSFRTIGVFVGLQLSMPSIVTMLSDTRIFALKSDLVFEFFDVTTQEQL